MRKKNNTIDMEFITQGYMNMSDRIGMGKYGIVYGPYYIALSPLQAIATQTKGKAEWEAMPILGRTADEEARVQTNADVAAYWVVSKDCQYPEAVFELMNFWYEKFYFNQDRDVYKEYINGPQYTGIYNNSPFISYRTWNNLTAFKEVEEVLKGTKKREDLGPIPLDYYDKLIKFTQDGVTDNWKDYAMYQAVLDGVQVYKEKNLFERDLTYFTFDNDLLSQKLATLQKKEREVFTKVIIGEYTIEQYDAFVDDWYHSGGNEILEYVNEWYKDFKRNFE